MKTKKFFRSFIACAMSLVIVLQFTVPAFASAPATVVATAVPYAFDILGEAYAIVEAADAVYAAESIIKSQALASTFYATDTAASAVLSSAPAVDVALTSGGKVASLTSGGAVASGTAGAPVVVTTLKVVAFAAVLSWCAGLFFEGLNQAGVDLGSVSSEKLADILVGYLGSEQTTYEEWIATPVLLADGTYSNPNDKALVTLVGGKFVVSDHFLAKARSFVDWITDNINPDGTISVGGEAYFIGVPNTTYYRVFDGSNYGPSISIDDFTPSFTSTSFLDLMEKESVLSVDQFLQSDLFAQLSSSAVDPISYAISNGVTSASNLISPVLIGSSLDGVDNLNPDIAGSKFETYLRDAISSALVDYSSDAKIPDFFYSYRDNGGFGYDRNVPLASPNLDYFASVNDVDVNNIESASYSISSNNTPFVIDSNSFGFSFSSSNKYTLTFHYTFNSVSYSFPVTKLLYSMLYLVPFFYYFDSYDHFHTIYAFVLNVGGPADIRMCDIILPSAFAPPSASVITNVPTPKPSIQVNPSTQAVGNTPVQYNENVNSSVLATPDITLDQFDTILDESFTDTDYEPDNPVISTDDPIPPISGGSSPSGSPDDDSSNILPSFTWNIGQWIYSLIRHYMPADIAEIVILGIEVLMFVLIVRLGLNFFS